jgi:hypothetical protein
MSQFIAAKCPSCGAPVSPNLNWIKCEACGSYIRLEQGKDGVPYMLGGRMINGQITVCSREIMQIMEQEGKQTRSELKIHQEIDKLGFDRLAQVNYLVFLALQRTELREQIRDYEKGTSGQKHVNEISTLRSKIASLNNRINLIDNNVRPDKEGPAKPDNSSTDGLLIFFIVLVIIAIVLLIIFLH